MEGLLSTGPTPSSFKSINYNVDISSEKLTLQSKPIRAVEEHCSNALKLDGVGPVDNRTSTNTNGGPIHL